MAEPGPEPKNPDQGPHVLPSLHGTPTTVRSPDKDVLQHGAYKTGSGLIYTSIWVPSHHILGVSPQPSSVFLGHSFFICKMKIILVLHL